MRTITKIACRTIGTLGMGIALYDTSRIASHHSKVGGEITKAKQLERAYFDSRTIENLSYSSNSIRGKVFELRSKNPLPTLWGKITGAIKGTFEGLGNHILTIGCSALALLSKGTLAKVGTIGFGIGLLLKVLREGFGLGKQHPMS